MNYRRYDAWVFVAGLMVLIVQWATNAGWLIVPFAVLLAASVLMPSTWVIRKRSSGAPDDGGFMP